MVVAITENISKNLKDYYNSFYLVRLKDNPEKYVGQNGRSLVDRENAILFKSDLEAKKARRKIANINKYDVTDFEIVNGLDQYCEESGETLTEDTDPNEEIEIYRGILADNLKEANRYIKSTKTLGAQDFGTGMYWTQSEEVAKNYGNYIYKTTIHRSDAKKILDAQDIVLLSKEFHKSLSPILVDQLDLGPGSKYTFYPKLWKDTEMVKEIQSRYKNYIENNNGILLEDEITQEFEKALEQGIKDGIANSK